MKSTIAKVTARVIVLMVMIAALASPLFAQTSGRIVGTIEDAQGAVLPGVTVTVTSPQLQGASTAVTDANGQFRFPTLPPGAYHVKAELAGFKSVDNDVRVGDRSDGHAADQDADRRRGRDGQRHGRLARGRHHVGGGRHHRRTGRLQPASGGARLLRHHQAGARASRRTPTVRRSTDRPAPRTSTSSTV